MRVQGWTVLRKSSGSGLGQQAGRIAEDARAAPEGWWGAVPQAGCARSLHEASQRPQAGAWLWASMVNRGRVLSGIGPQGGEATPPIGGRGRDLAPQLEERGVASPYLGWRGVARLGARRLGLRAPESRVTPAQSVAGNAV